MKDAFVETFISEILFIRIVNFIRFLFSVLINFNEMALLNW